MCGRSRGGLMTYLALARTDRLAAAVVEAGMSDAVTGVKKPPNGAGLRQTHTRLRQGSSRQGRRSPRPQPRPVGGQAVQADAGTLAARQCHWRVDPANTLHMAAALLHAHHPFRLVLFDGGDHALTEHRPEADRMTRDCLDRYVRDRSPPPNLEPHGN